MKTLVLVAICFSTIIMLGAFADSSKSSSSSAEASEYSRCIHSNETKFMVQVKKQQYKSISDSQIAHILCKN